jgi:hypothetical protein
MIAVLAEGGWGWSQSQRHQRRVGSSILFFFYKFLVNKLELMPAFPGTHCSMSKVRALTKLLLCATILFSNLYTLSMRLGKYFRTFLFLYILTYAEENRM